MISLIINENGW